MDTTSAATMSGTMHGTDGLFKDYDHADIYRDVQGWLQSPKARNFVVEFGQNEAKIARDLDSTQFERLINHDQPQKSLDRPVRWM
jgi:hypothetical protein